MAEGHKLYTERTNGGVIAECQGEGCNWSGKHSYKKRDRTTGVTSTVEDPVFPNRQLAVASHKEHHKEDNNG